MIKELDNKKTSIAKNTFIAENASVIGDVTLDEESSIWYGAVVRGDIAFIKIGKRSNVQDCAVIHVDYNVPTIIGNDVTIGHGAIVHGCRINDRCIIGMGAVILSNSVIGHDSIVGAGSVVTERKEFPPESLIIGAPARVIRKITKEEIKAIKENAKHYIDLSNEHMKEQHST